MSKQPLPARGSVDWYAYMQDVDTATSDVMTGRLADASLKAAFASRWAPPAPLEAGIPTVMASPPTITGPTTTGTSAITGAVAVSALDGSSQPNTAAFAFRGGPWHQYGTVYPDTVYAYRQPLTGGEPAIFVYPEFLWYGTTFEFGYKGQGDLSSRVWVDGRLAESTYTADTTQDGGLHLRKVTFSSAGWHRIRIDLAPPFWGVNIGPNDVILPAPAGGDKLLVIHDSYGEGVGSSDDFRSYAPLVSNMLGFRELISLSQGGTGVLAVNSSLGRPKYRDRSGDWAAINATHVLVGMSVNDDGYTAAQVSAELALLLDAVNALPTVRQVWVMGPAPRDHTQNADRVARDAAYEPVVTGKGATYVSLVSPTSMWSAATDATITWQSGATSQHPTNAGHEGIARTFVSRLLAQIA